MWSYVNGIAEVWVDENIQLSIISNCTHSIIEAPGCSGTICSCEAMVVAVNHLLDLCISQQRFCEDLLYDLPVEEHRQNLLVCSSLHFPFSSFKNRKDISR